MNGREVGEDTVISALINSKKDLTYIYIRKGNNIIYEPTSARDIQKIVTDELDEGATYKERVVEVKTGGKYLMADDGTEIEIAHPDVTGKNKIYIFYTKQ